MPQSLFQKSHPFSVDMVVAKYKEDTRWCESFTPHCQLLIYDKGQAQSALSLPNIPSFACPCFRGTRHDKTPMGRESHTYLYHILKHYPNFADFTLFCQGRVLDHAPLFSDLLKHLLNLDHPPGFFHFGKTELNSLPDAAPYHRGLPLERVYRRLFKEAPEDLWLFQLSSNFWVSRDLLLSRSLRFYEEMMQIIYDEPLSGYIFERLWSFILQKSTKEPQNWDKPVQRNLWKLSF